MAKRTLPTVSAGQGGLARYLQEIRRFPMLEPDEEYMLAKRWTEHADSDAAHKLVTSHLRLVARMAMRYRGYGLPIGEVISEGNVGLMQAVKRFDPEKGFRLATYAMWWIRASAIARSAGPRDRRPARSLLSQPRSGLGLVRSIISGKR